VDTIDNKKAEGHLMGLEEMANLLHVVERHKPSGGFTKCLEPSCVAALQRYKLQKKRYANGHD